MEQFEKFVREHGLGTGIHMDAQGRRMITLSMLSLYTIATQMHTQGMREVMDQWMQKTR